jgi:hypothetical protein
MDKGGRVNIRLSPVYQYRNPEIQVRVYAFHQYFVFGLSDYRKERVRIFHFFAGFQSEWFDYPVSPFHQYSYPFRQREQPGRDLFNSFGGWFCDSVGIAIVHSSEGCLNHRIFGDAVRMEAISIHFIHSAISTSREIQ